MIRRTMGDRMLMGSFYAINAIFAVLCVIPFLLVLTSSFADEASLLQDGYRLIPKEWSLSAYQVLFEDNTIYRAYGVTLFVTIGGTILSIVMTSAIAYAVSVKSLRYRNKIQFYVYFTLLFNGGLVPWYILITNYLKLGNSIWVMILPALVNPWLMFLLRNFFQTIPESLAESAKIDGANDIYILFRIILPLSLPALATISLFYALDYWNEWFRAILFIDDSTKYPLQTIIIKTLSSVSIANTLFVGATINVPAYTIRMATVIVTIGPIVFLYPMIQKYFIKGLMVGAVKG